MSNAKKETGGLTEMISMRLSPEDLNLLDSVSDLLPAVPRLALGRLALRIGLETIRRAPARALMSGKK